MIPLGDDGFRSVVWKLLAISTRTHNQTNSTLRQVVHCLFVFLDQAWIAHRDCPQISKAPYMPQSSSTFSLTISASTSPSPSPTSSHSPSDFRAFVQQKFATLNAAFKQLDSLLLFMIRACQRSPVIVVRPSQSCYLIGRQRSSQISTPPSLAYCRGRAI